jgi:tRNA-specific 2-thiouridylase
MAKRVVVGMSGGVDSSVTAALLVEQGYDVIGITLNVWPKSLGMDEPARANGCCGLDSVEDARRVSNMLGIPYYNLNFREIFEDRVVKDFIREYLRGRTPNPCVRCNQFIKFDALLAKAMALGADYVATGHYARIERGGSGRWMLRKAVDSRKDQSYVLYVMTQARLERTLFPLGGMTKEQTRALATELRLVTAEKRDSQEICFVPYKRYGEYMEKHAPEVVREGPILDVSGRMLGMHKGIAFHTIGQRRGLGVAATSPLYVVDLIPETNTVVVGSQEDLLRRECVAEEVNWIARDDLTEPLRVEAKVRYRAEPASAVVTPGDAGRVDIVFDDPQRAITPGQSIVFYDGEWVVGGGTIA